MSAGWAFIAGWLSASLFILVCVLLERRDAARASGFDSTSQFMSELELAFPAEPTPAAIFTHRCKSPRPLEARG